MRGNGMLQERCTAGNEKNKLLYKKTTSALRFFFFFNDPATTEFSPLPLPDALPISRGHASGHGERVEAALPEVLRGLLTRVAVAADHRHRGRRIESQRLERRELVHRRGRQGAKVERRTQRDTAAGDALGGADVEQLHALALVEAARQVGGGDTRDGRRRHGGSVSRASCENRTSAGSRRTPVFRAREYIVNAFTSTISSIVLEGVRDAVHPAHHARRVHGRRPRRREKNRGVSG